MDADTDTSLELRVLYGPQAGSRLSLAVGEYLLGSSDECAILLSGPRMEEQHALLTVDERGATLKPMGGSVCDAMGNEIADEFALTPGLPVELGGTSIAVDRADAQWPAAQAVAPMTASHQPLSPAADAHPGVAAVETGASAGPWAKPLKLLRWVVIAVAAAFAVTAMAFALAGWMEGQAAAPVEQQVSPEASAPAPTEPPADAPPRTLMDMVTQINASKALTLTRQDDGNWLVAGYVRTASLKQSLLDALREVSPQPTLRVYAEDDLVAAAVKALNARDDLGDTAMQVESTGEGALRLVGAAHGVRQVETAQAALVSGVPGVRRVDSAVLFPDQLLAKLKAQLAAAKLADRVVFVSERPEVVLKGKLSLEELDRWNDLYAEFNDAYGDVLPVRASLAPPAPAPAPVRRAAVEVKTIVGGAVPYIVTDKGVRVNRGGDINGHRLSAVHDSEVLFEGEERLRIAR